MIRLLVAALTLAVVLAACEAPSTVVLPSPSPSAVATPSSSPSPSPSPSPTPNPCVIARWRSQAYRDGSPEPIYAWGLGIVPTVRTEPMDAFDQPLASSCPYPRTARWEITPATNCFPQGDTAGLAIRLRCTVTGDVRTDTWIAGSLPEDHAQGVFKVINGPSVVTLSNARALGWIE